MDMEVEKLAQEISDAFPGAQAQATFITEKLSTYDDVLSLCTHLLRFHAHDVIVVLPRILIEILNHRNTPLVDKFAAQILFSFLNVPSENNYCREELRNRQDEAELAQAKHDILDLLDHKQSTAILKWLGWAEHGWTALKDGTSVDIQMHELQAAKQYWEEKRKEEKGSGVIK